MNRSCTRSINTSDFQTNMVFGAALVPFLHQCPEEVLFDENGEELNVIVLSFHCQPSFSFLVRFSTTRDPLNDNLPIFAEIVFCATEGR